MVARLKQFIAPPVFANEEQNHVARILNVILLTLLVSGLLMIIIMALYGHELTTATLAVDWVVTLGCYGLMRRGHLRAAGVGALLMLLMMTAFILYAGFGIHDPAVLLLPIIIIISGLILDDWLFAMFTGVSVLTVGFIILLEINGYIEKAIFTRDSKALEFVIYATLLLVTAVTVRLLSQSLKNNLIRARQSEARWRSLVDNAPDRILNVNQNGVIEFINTAASSPSEAYVGKTIYEFTHPDYHDIVRQSLAQVYQTGVPLSYESLVVGQGGQSKWFSTRVGPLRQEDQIAGLILIATDISERRRIELALQYERDFAQLIITNMGQGLTLTDAAGRFLYVNPAYSAMTGYTMAELVGKSPYDLAEFEIMAALQEQKKRRQSGESTTYESRIRHADGHIIHALITGVPRWQNGEVVGTIAVVTDLTEQKRTSLEREHLITELEVRNAELERFTYTVSHDLKSPLVTIKGFLGLLEQDLTDDNRPQVRQAMFHIFQAARTMEALLNDLLELSRVGRLINPPEPVEFAEIVADAWSLVAGRLENRNVILHTASDLPIVLGDRPRLVEVMQNLLDNALKFSREQDGALIEVGTERRQAETLLFVRDNGCGIDPRYHEKVFGLFERLDTSIEGTGIGLALVKRIIEVHNGRLWVESAGKGQGSTFYFTLPIVVTGEGSGS